jgi:hypothetical protein
MKKVVVTTSIIIIIALLLVGCTSTSSNSTTTPTETITPTTGDIQGKLLSANTTEPLAGAAIILGLVTGELECTLQSDLVAVVGEDGTFELVNVPPGTYVVFYDPSGEAKDSWENIDKLKIDLRWYVLGPAVSTLDGATYFDSSGSVVPVVSEVDGAFIFNTPFNKIYTELPPYEGPGTYINGDFFITFGGGGTVVITDGKGIRWFGEYALWIEAAFSSIKYGLTLEFHETNPLSIEVKAGETSNIEIMAMVTDVTSTDSSGN